MASSTRRRMPSEKPWWPCSVRSCRTVFKNSESVWLVMYGVVLLVVFRDTPTREQHDQPSTRFLRDAIRPPSGSATQRLATLAAAPPPPKGGGAASRTPIYRKEFTLPKVTPDGKILVLMNDPSFPSRDRLFQWDETTGETVIRGTGDPFVAGFELDGDGTGIYEANTASNSITAISLLDGTVRSRTPFSFIPGSDIHFLVDPQRKGRLVVWERFHGCPFSGSNRFTVITDNRLGPSFWKNGCIEAGIDGKESRLTLVSIQEITEFDLNDPEVPEVWRLVPPVAAWSAPLYHGQRLFFGSGLVAERGTTNTSVLNNVTGAMLMDPARDRLYHLQPISSFGSNPFLRVHHSVISSLQVLGHVNHEQTRDYIQSVSRVQMSSRGDLWGFSDSYYPSNVTLFRWDGALLSPPAGAELKLKEMTTGTTELEITSRFTHIWELSNEGPLHATQLVWRLSVPDTMKLLSVAVRGQFTNSSPSGSEYTLPDLPAGSNFVLLAGLETRQPGIGQLRSEIISPVGSSSPEGRITTRLTEVLPFPTIVVPSGIVTESGSFGGVPILLSRRCHLLVSVDVSAQGVSAIEGTDFVMRPKRYVFQPGVTRGAVSFEALTDSIREGDERFLIKLGNPTNG
ncbi:MAG: hypothetical protein FJ405_16190, partial [Verrucomicrobia bacterium]|nr:hypothetical protein [Verrucomicrobiota bacterium]